MAKDDIYVSVDIEADGPVPGPNSMLSLGAAAFRDGSTVPIGTFEVNLAPLPGSNPDPDTMAWWAKQDPAVWAHVTDGPEDPTVGMARFSKWASNLGGDPILVVFPTWDFMWVHYYLVRFLGKRGNPFGIGSLDIKSFAFGMLPQFDHFKDVSKRKMPSEYLVGCPPHTHKALDDALGQGIWLMNLLAARRGN